MKPNLIVHGAVERAMNVVVDWAQYTAVYWAWDWAAFMTVDRSVDRSVSRAVHNALDTASRGESQHPTLGDFLAAAGAEAARKSNLVVYWAVYGDGSMTVSGAMEQAVYWDVSMTLREAVQLAEVRALLNVMYQAVDVYWAVRWTVCHDPPHPSLDDFLTHTGAEAS